LGARSQLRTPVAILVPRWPARLADALDKVCQGIGARYLHTIRLRPSAHSRQFPDRGDLVRRADLVAAALQWLAALTKRTVRVDVSRAGFNDLAQPENCLLPA
jgi:hypothetical protein